ncbi:helix-turn-helix transcriptional regulator [Hymenobacter sp. ASUV-10]|uniref:Helix-turn-helix transcriptional regulator n=1 Tax=Hymenobacter aranciens TaxID=3063996 RepID=A0ABT9BFE4_9BACT|nr:helix-turn-helix transcriptional regulator [Hymenobacter sp. ASUV-10]MDO7876995.1 helix-turn-helix transcriptional regulator [Hymenobacter sp. ASUV-10]
MPRPAAYSDTLLARVRRHYGLSQAELAALLGLSGAQLSRLEAGQQGYSPALRERLGPFLLALPPAAEASARHLAEAQAEAASLLPPPPPGPVEAGLLERRRAACLHEARTLRWRLRHLPAQAAVAARWAQAMPALLADLPPAPPEATTAEAARLRYVHAWLATVPLALDAGQLAEWHLGYARAQALEAEAAALATVLAS